MQWLYQQDSVLASFVRTGCSHLYLYCASHASHEMADTSPRWLSNTLRDEWGYSLRPYVHFIHTSSYFSVHYRRTYLHACLDLLCLPVHVTAINNTRTFFRSCLCKVCCVWITAKPCEQTAQARTENLCRVFINCSAMIVWIGKKTKEALVAYMNVLLHRWRRSGD